MPVRITPLTTLSDDNNGLQAPIQTTTAGSFTIYSPSVLSGGDLTLATVTVTFAANSRAVAVGFHSGYALANYFKLRIYMNGVQVSESAYIAASPGTTTILIGTSALSGSNICYLSAYNYGIATANLNTPGASPTTGASRPIAVGIGVQSIKVT